MFFLILSPWAFAFRVALVVDTLVFTLSQKEFNVCILNSVLTFVSQQNSKNSWALINGRCHFWSISTRTQINCSVFKSDRTYSLYFFSIHKEWSIMIFLIKILSKLFSMIKSYLSSSWKQIDPSSISLPPSKSFSRHPLWESLP